MNMRKILVVLSFVSLSACGGVERADDAEGEVINTTVGATDGASCEAEGNLCIKSFDGKTCTCRDGAGGCWIQDKATGKWSDCPKSPAARGKIPNHSIPDQTLSH